MKKFFFYLLTVWAVLWLQVLSNHFLGGSWFSMDFVLIIVLFFGLSRGPVTGQLLGFVWGLLTDASSLGLMGMHTLLYAAAGYSAGMLRRQLDETKAWTQAIFSFGVSWLYLLLYLGIDRVFSTSGRPFSWPIAAQPLANALVAPLFFWILGQWSAAWSMGRMEN